MAKRPKPCYVVDIGLGEASAQTDRCLTKARAENFERLIKSGKIYTNVWREYSSKRLGA